MHWAPEVSQGGEAEAWISHSTPSCGPGGSCLSVLGALCSQKQGEAGGRNQEWVGVAGRGRESWVPALRTPGSASS